MSQTIDTHLEAGAQTLPLPRGCSGQNDVRVLRRLIDEEVHVSMELERAERATGQVHVGLRDQKIGPKRHQHAHGIGMAIEDRAIGIARGDPAVESRTQGTFG